MLKDALAATEEVLGSVQSRGATAASEVQELAATNQRLHSLTAQARLESDAARQISGRGGARERLARRGARVDAPSAAVCLDSH